MRCHWFGKLANPTYPVSFLRTMFLFSITDGLAVDLKVDTSGASWSTEGGAGGEVKGTPLAAVKTKG